MSEQQRGAMSERPAKTHESGEERLTMWCLRCSLTFESPPATSVLVLFLSRSWLNLSYWRDTSA